VIVMLLGLFWNFWSFVVLFTVIHFGCWYEFVKLMKKIHGEKFLPYCLLGFVYITMPVLMMLMLALPHYPSVSESSVIKASFSVLLPAGIIFSIWINDTMAYVVGSLIGKTPFSKISPKKTWEGTAGGAILCVITIGLLGYFIPGSAGDLLESKIKRLADVKDSGSFMPGHGGFLDRFDSLLVATPFVWLYVWLFV
jgi:phosphatidate cytidylyltransferase